MPKAKSNTSTKPKQSKKATEQVPSDALPRKSLEDALRVARAIKENYGAKGGTWEDIASALGFSANNPNNKYFLWAAASYGLISKGEGGVYTVAEIARKILAPTYDGEDREGIVKAIATPSILARFYSDYSSSLLPAGEIFKNVLEQKYGVPGGRVEETINLILENSRFAKLLEEQPDGRLKLLSGNAAVGVGGAAESNISSDGPEIGSLAIVDETQAIDYGKTCFIITPIGDDGSPERKHADAILKHLIIPALEGFGILAARADKISKPGHITKQVVEHVAYSKLCITDLSFGNQNAHYELGIRHALKLPSIQIIRKGDKIPFDIQQGRTIIIDTSDPYTIMDRIASAKAELVEHVRTLLDSNGAREESPITMYLPRLQVKIG